jgi:SAM-dependent methyltransferase
MTVTSVQQRAEVPSPIDFHDLAQARSWVDDTVTRRPCRPRFFEAFSVALSTYFEQPFSVAELGSGPGHLAKAVLAQCNVAAYAAVDFSNAMHTIAREHLGQAASAIRFVLADFRESNWAGPIASVDAVITMQAAHEVRHKSRLPALFRQIRDVVRPGGLFLFCDHYAETGSTKNSELFLSSDEQPILLAEAGFSEVVRLLDEGGMGPYTPHSDVD